MNPHIEYSYQKSLAISDLSASLYQVFLTPKYSLEIMTEISTLPK